MAIVDKSVEKRLTEAGFSLPMVSEPVAEYVPAKQVKDLVYVSGQGPIQNGKAVYVDQRCVQSRGDLRVELSSSNQVSSRFPGRSRRGHTGAWVCEFGTWFS